MAVVGPIVEAELAKIANQQAQQVQQPQPVQQAYQQPAQACTVDGVELPF